MKQKLLQLGDNRTSRESQLHHSEGNHKLKQKCLQTKWSDEKGKT